MTTRSFVLSLALVVSTSSLARALQENTQPTIEDKVAGMTPLEGFFNIYWDEDTGKIHWEIDRFESEFLYQIGLTTGLGSNPVGLDRGQLGGTYVVEFHRIGPKILMVEPNQRYRARSDDPDEVRAVAEAFAPSTIWGFTVEAETDGRVLVDATDFFMRDAHGVVSRLKARNQGTFRLDKSRSAVHLPRTRAFPQNTEVEVSLTFTSDSPGGLVRSTAASGSAVTLRVHHSLVELPDDNYTPRLADPRMNSFGISFADYASPIDERLSVRWISRHRLQKRNPGVAVSNPVEPIVYYVDRGTPEPIRSALIEGASWWAEAFEEAGFTNAFRVELLPADADPMDLRYNMIHWTHRSTRGWSYGNSVTDPRTGEIIKGNVNLGSLRLKQDFLLATGLTSAGSASDCDFCGGPQADYLAQITQQDPLEMALARVRQLSAHEVGHTLGFAHNYIASTYADRASVMDYPAPMVGIVDGQLDLTDAYAVGIGEFDKFSVKWAYSQFPQGTDEAGALNAIVQEGLNRGMRFLSDQDARSAGAAHPLAGLWDNGSDPVATLRHEMEVRRIGIEGFSRNVLEEGEPLALLEETFVPLYFHHRYQTEAAAKSIGGVDYSYFIRGGNQQPMAIVDPERQMDALDAVLETISPEALAVPQNIVDMIPPRAFFMSSGEQFNGATDPTFDPLSVAAAAAEFSLAFIFQSERMARLVDHNARNDDYPSLEDVVDRVMGATWNEDFSRDSYLREVLRTTQRVVLDMILAEASDGDNTAQVRAILTWKVRELQQALSTREATPHRQMALDDITRWLNRPEGITEPSEVPSPPAGSPIGVRN